MFVFNSNNQTQNSLIIKHLTPFNDARISNFFIFYLFFKLKKFKNVNQMVLLDKHFKCV
jgi:hypothetical protein